MSLIETLKLPVLPCPFCGGKGDDLYHLSEKSDERDLLTTCVICIKCGTHGPLAWQPLAGQEVVQQDNACLAWNNR
jgi:hypothetical protein